MVSEQGKPLILTFPGLSSAKSQAACSQCQKAHRKCRFDGDFKCQRCVKLDIDCSLSNVTHYPHKKPDLVSSESVYARVFQQKTNRLQYITSTQPLAPILSRDSMLYFDGEILGLFSPWKDAHYDKQVANYDLMDLHTIDPDLISFLNKKRAFELPKKQVQSKLLKLYFENVYPLYPVVDRNIKLEEIPPLLLNAIMLSAIRYSTDVETIRIKADEFRSKCQYLEMIETNKLTLIQSFLLISIHEEGQYGSSISKEYVSKAIILCVQLSLQVLGETNLEIETDKDIEISKLKYGKSLLLRIFWTSFCCDRYSAVTSGSAMIYNTSDMLIEEPTLRDFNDSEADYMVFTRWLSLCHLFDRILSRTYKPPGRRSIDDLIEKDLLNWEDCYDLKNLKIDLKFRSFLSLTYCYCNLLFLRCRIGVLNLLEITEEDQQNITIDETSLTPLSFSGMKYVNFFALKIISLLEDQSFVHFEHTIKIHSLLHVLVFIHLEIQVKDEVEVKNNELLDILEMKKNQLKDGLELLKRFRSKWWLSGAAYELFNVLLSDKSLTNVDSFQKFYSQFSDSQLPNLFDMSNDQ